MVTQLTCLKIWFIATEKRITKHCSKNLVTHAERDSNLSLSRDTTTQSVNWYIFANISFCGVSAHKYKKNLFYFRTRSSVEMIFEKFLICLHIFQIDGFLRIYL